MAKLSRRNIKLQRSVTNPLYFFHVMSHGLEHLPDLTVLAFNQRNFVPGIVGFANGLDPGRRGLLSSAALALDVNTGPQFRQTIRRWCARHLDHVSLGN